jgi:hypothetical protein
MNNAGTTLDVSCTRGCQLHTAGLLYYACLCDTYLDKLELLCVDCLGSRDQVLDELIRNVV